MSNGQTFDATTISIDGSTDDHGGNWHARIGELSGMEIHFAPYQFGARLAETITVPWSALSDVLAPDMAG
jgi:hypothetical protein